MRRVITACVALMGLTACAVSGPSDTGTIKTPAHVTPADDAARMFVSAISNVEPLSEAICENFTPGRSCDFRVVIDDTAGLPANAYQTVDPTGRPIIAFTISMLAQVRNEDEMAFVLAHEMSHHILGHLERQMRNANVGAMVLGGIAEANPTALPEEIERAAQLGAQLGARTYSKNYELEADELGALIAQRAGYDPLSGAAFFLRIPDPGNRFLGTHPSNAERIAAVQRVLGGL